MDKLYNTVLAAYRARFGELSPRTQFHLASRLYLWQQDLIATEWLATLRPWFTADDNPEQAIRQLVAEQPPELGQTGRLRAPYFAKYPQLRQFERMLFRALFIENIYGLDARQVINEQFDLQAFGTLYDDLLIDSLSLTQLSSFGINFLYLFERFFRQDDTGLPIEKLLKASRTAYDQADAVQQQLRCYFYTHAIVGESLFYYRNIPERRRPLYMEMLAAAEALIARHFETLKLDNKFEFLVCCRLLGYSSKLESRIMQAAAEALSPEGFINEPRDRRSPDLRRAEHRNVLFLMSQRPFQPLSEQ